MKLQVNPIHAWGWFDDKGTAVDVPAAFSLTVTVTQEGDPFTSVLGQVPDGAHPLAGLWLILSRRQSPFERGFDGNCNLFAFTAKPVVPRINEALTDKPCLTGYVRIDELQD